MGDVINIFEQSGAAWIWPAALGQQPNQYVEYRQQFELDACDESSDLVISADTNYALWINGRFVDFGQYSDYPDDKICDVLPVGAFLKPGKNVLCAIIYYQGLSTSQYLKGLPGVIFALRVGDKFISSGPDTYYRLSPAYKNGVMPRITPQLGYVFEYDARGYDDWINPGYSPNTSWLPISDNDISPLKGRPVRRVRPIAKLVLGDRCDASITAQGLFRRTRQDAGSVAKLMQSDYLSSMTGAKLFGPSAAPNFGAVPAGLSISSSVLDGADGAYIIIDLGKEEAGILELDVETAAGVVIDIANGEHLDDLRVRAKPGIRNFGYRYICSEGRQQFTHYLSRMAGRYIQLHISGFAESFTLHYAGLRPTDYPVLERGSFECSDSLQNIIYKTSVRTLHLCMHEHYEDCPWREQALYSMDARNQALAGYYCFGDYAFPEASFDLLRLGMKPDGFLELCAPAEISITIPMFSYAWALAQADLYLYSGDADVLRRAYPRIKQMLDMSWDKMVNGLLPCPLEDKYWHFYDWADGLNGYCEDYKTAAESGHLRFDAPLNLFYCLTLEAAGSLASALGNADDERSFKARVEFLRSHIHQAFWDNDRGAYFSYLGVGAPSHYCEFTQALAILTHTCPAAVSDSLRELLANPDNGLVKTTLSHSLYKYEALLIDKDRYAGVVFDQIRADYGYMLGRGATSFWETLKGADDFAGGGSLCHGWSGIPAYFYHAYLLGIKPAEPGFKRVTFDPIFSAAFEASGTIPTPHGPIHISWNRSGDAVNYDIKKPDCVEIEYPASSSTKEANRKQ